MISKKEQQRQLDILAWVSAAKEPANLSQISRMLRIPYVSVVHNVAMLAAEGKLKTHIEIIRGRSNRLVEIGDGHSI